MSTLRLSKSLTNTRYLGLTLIVWAASFLPFQINAQSPPFSGIIPSPIGLDTSPAILLVIDPDGSLRVKSDPAQPPFDGIEDTLFGVRNNSTKSISAIPLRGSQTIFAFDNDGICAVNPHPPGCPFGRYGYEGPGVSFSGISADQKSGVVNFSPAIPPGGTAYFGLEEAIQTLCAPISPPDRLLQGDPAWASIKIGKSQLTIGRFGCFITSGAMLINYHAAKQGSSFRTDPLKLDLWLTGKNAYTKDGQVKGDGGSFIAEYARANGINLWFVQQVRGRDDFTLDQYLCGRQPPMLYMDIPHWVLPVGQTTVAGIDTYSVLDPDSYPNGGTLQGFHFTYQGMFLFTDGGGSLAGLYITAHSPVELVLTAPDGAQTGLNPLTNFQASSIPQSGYGDFSSLVDDESHSLQPVLSSKTIAVVNPGDGDYTLEVIGTGTGPFSLDFVGYDANGSRRETTLTGNVRPGLTLVYGIKYSSVPGVGIQVKAPLMIADLIAAVQTARRQGLIDSDGMANSLLAKLQAAAAASARGDIKAAKNILTAFINEVSAQTGKKISIDIASVLVADAQVVVL